MSTPFSTMEVTVALISLEVCCNCVIALPWSETDVAILSAVCSISEIFPSRSFAVAFRPSIDFFRR